MKRKILFHNLTLMLLLFLAGYHSVPAEDQHKQIQANKLYEKALANYQRGKNDLAIEQLKAAIALNEKFARAYNQLALIYMDEGTVAGRFKATIELEKALRLEPKNTGFLFNYATLNLKKGFTRIAEKQFHRILKSAPQNYRAYFQLAQLKEQEMLHYQNMISVDPGSDGIIFFDSFAKKLYESTADYYRKAIAANPKFSDGYYRLALIYYEVGRFDEMIQLLQSAVKIIPGDKYCHLFLGFAYQNSGKFQLAAGEYQLAKALMNAAEREALESIALILSPDQKREYDLVVKSSKDLIHHNYWIAKDPFFLTPLNERELEHFSRLAYANLRFSRPGKNIEGWQTDRGKVYIRYGKPDEVYRTRAYLGTLVGASRNPLHHSREIWIYPGFDFIFEDRYLSSNYTFAWGDKPGTDYKEIYEDRIKTIPDYYKLIPDSQFFAVPYDIVAFMGQDGKTELECCFAIPLVELNRADANNKDFNLLQGIFFFDQNWNPVLTKIRELNFNTSDFPVLDSTSFYRSHVPVDLLPGKYHFALEFEDGTSKKRSRVLRKVVVDTFLRHRFQISNILFADEITPPNLNVIPSRSDFKILPNPTRLYQSGQVVVIYYEIYNLSQDQQGETHFRIEYRIGKDDQSRSIVKRLLTNVGIMKKRGEVTAGYEYTSNSTSELQYQSIVLDPDLTGKISINLKATDLVSGSVVEKQEVFAVTN